MDRRLGRVQLQHQCSQHPQPPASQCSLHQTVAAPEDDGCCDGSDGELCQYQGDTILYTFVIRIKIIKSESTSVVLHHTKAHLKPAMEGAAFPTHQDYHYFPYKHDSMMAMFVHLDDTDQSNGGLGIFPGSHHQGPQVDKISRMMMKSY